MESLERVAPLLAHAAFEALCPEIQSLHIKGPVAEMQGLRMRHQSADADILVEPGGVPRAKIGLARGGWVPRQLSSLDRSFRAHAVSFVHPSWPCDIDVHERFPGFLATDEVIFELLWRRRETLNIADVAVQVPDRLASVLLQAAHSLRTGLGGARSREEFANVQRVVQYQLTNAERDEIVTLATRLGALDTLRPLLRHTGLPLPKAVEAGIDSDLDAWRVRVGAGPGRLAKSLVGAANRPAVSRRTLLAHAIWPSGEDMRIDHPEIPPGRGPLLRARWARFGRGLRSIPGVVRGYRLARRGVTDASALKDPQ